MRHDGGETERRPANCPRKRRAIRAEPDRTGRGERIRTSGLHVPNADWSVRIGLDTFVRSAIRVRCPLDRTRFLGLCAVPVPRPCCARRREGQRGPPSSNSPSARCRVHLVVGLADPSDFVSGFPHPASFLNGSWRTVCKGLFRLDASRWGTYFVKTDYRLLIVDLRLTLKVEKITLKAVMNNVLRFQGSEGSC